MGLSRVTLAVMLPLIVAFPSRGRTCLLGQDTQPNRKAAAVVVTQSAGQPGGTAAVPILFTSAESAPAGVLTMRIRYAPGQLTFTKVELGGVAASVDAVSEAATEPLGEEMVLNVKISTPEKDGIREPLPDGPLAQLMFIIKKDQKPQMVIPLKVEATLAGIKSGASPARVASKDGEVIVANPVVISCFFYMH